LQSRISDLTDDRDHSSTRFRPTSKILAGIKKADKGDVSLDSVGTEESEDVLGDMSAEIPAVGDVSMATTATAEENAHDIDEEEEEVEEVEEDDDEKEETDDDEDDLDDTESEADSEVESDAESEFQAQDEKSISSASPSPPRRQSTKRRPTVSPTKSRATPAKPVKTVRPVKAKKASPAKRGSTGHVKDNEGLISPPPLQERTRQESVVEISDDEVQVIKPKKKR
jgi:hypothetical protein